MKKKITLLLLTLMFAACAGKKTTQSSGDARREIEDRYNNRVGTATKEDFTQEYGPANWCRPLGAGGETCRFYKKIAVVWTGETNDRVHRETFDEVIADFNSEGILKSFKAAAQR